MSVVDLENSSCGQLINSPDVADLASSNCVKFRARFRDLLVPLCVEHNVFNIRRENSGIPVHFRVHIGLRYLARAHDSDTMEELSHVKRSTCHTIFHQFITGMVKHFFHDFISIPEGENLRRVMNVYKM